MQELFTDRDELVEMRSRLVQGMNGPIQQTRRITEARRCWDALDETIAAYDRLIERMNLVRDEPQT